MNNVRKYPNRADKNLFLFLFLAAAVVIQVAIAVVVVLVKIEINEWLVLLIGIATFVVLMIPLTIWISVATSPKKNTPRGEKRYQLEIENLKKVHSDYYFISHIDGIDDIIISPYGVYAITKRSYEGRIYGMDSEESWRQSFAFTKKKNALPNPIKEFETVTTNFKKKHNIKYDVIPVVVLLSNNRGYINSKTLYAPSELGRLFNNLDKEVLSQKEMEVINNSLQKSK